jgi:predicted TIM-barrel fold metal-dependent hydrolase
MLAAGARDDIGFLDKTLDVDSHEMAPAHFWGPMFGTTAGKIATLSEGLLKKLGEQKTYNPDLKGDLAEITPENVWNIRGTDAPGAFDFKRRLQVMDLMGITKALVFPSYAILPAMFLSGDARIHRDILRLQLSETEIRRIGRDGMDEYNDWAVATTNLSPDRLRCVAYVIDDGTVQSLLDKTRDLVNRGIRAINIPPGTPPGGVSPADPALDPFWALLEEKNVPCLLHVGNEFGFLSASAWGRAPAFAPGKVSSTEIGLEPYSMSTLHLPASHFLTIMVLGGVFERFPHLRFGVIETGSMWLGPLAEHLDMWAREVYSKRLAAFLTMLPSEYLARNVRVTPFNRFEPIEDHFREFPQLQDCYCYSTDYPHVEGGKDIKRVFYERLSPLGTETMMKFFVKNGEWLLPD